MHCEICGCTLEVDIAVCCAQCGSPFHRDCWEFNGRCGIYGCGATDAGPYEPAAVGAVVAIDENTRPPLRLEPYLESLIRRVPVWGRTFLPTAILGAIGAGCTIAVGTVIFGTIKAKAVLLLAGCGIATAVLAGFLGTWLRRRPARAFSIFAIAFTVLGFITTTLAWKSYVLVGIYGVFGALASSAFVEFFAGRLRRAGSWGYPLILVRSLLMGLFFYGFLYLLWVSGGCVFRARELWVLPFLGFFVATLPLELAKSALHERLRLEAAREKEKIARGD